MFDDRHGPLRRPRLLSALLLTAACASTAGPADETEPRTATLDQNTVAVQTFDEVWTTVKETHFDPDLNGVDWDAVRAELRPKAAQAEDDDELREIINDMLGRLGQSHFGMMPRSVLPELDGSVTTDGNRDTPEDLAGGAGFGVRVRDGRVLVFSVAEDGPAAAAGVRPGWILTDLNGDDLDARVERVLEASHGDRHAMFGLTLGIAQGLIGPVGSTLPLTFVDGEGAEVEVEIERGPRDVVAHEFGTNLPTFYLHFEDEILERDGARVGRIHFTNWFLPMQGEIDRAVDEMRDCEGIVIDLRGNGGGAGGMVMSTAGHFFPERTKLGTQTTRGGTIIYNALPRKLSTDGERVEPFSGPVAILIDELSGSASEIFAGGMQSTGRVRVFGETSAGAVLPATTRSLPNGDGLLYAMGDFVTSTGVLLEGVGVIPDEEVPLTREGLLAERDPVLEAALDWILAEAGE